MATRLTNGGIISAIAKAHYAATAEQVEQLAHVAASGVHAGTAYLRIIVAHMQSRLGRPRRGRQLSQMPVLEIVHKELYPNVLRGVGPEEMESSERNVLATFARTMVTTVRRFIESGGDIRGLEVASVTKSQLRKTAHPATEAPEGETRVQRGFRNASESLVRAANRLARGDPDDARQRIEGLMDQLETLLGELPEAQEDVPAQTTTIVAGRASPGRSTAVAPQLHRGA